MLSQNMRDIIALLDGKIENDEKVVFYTSKHSYDPKSGENFYQNCLESADAHEEHFGGYANRRAIDGLIKRGYFNFVRDGWRYIVVSKKGFGK